MLLLSNDGGVFIIFSIFCLFLSVCSKEVSDFVTAQEIVDLLKPGDLVEFRRSIYSHWGIYIGKENGQHMIMHYWRKDGVRSGNEFKEILDGSSAEIRRDDLYRVAGNSNKVRINNEEDLHWAVLSVDEILQRALSREGESSYNLANNNCEHYAKWCRYGTNYSKQAYKVKMSVANIFISAVAGKEHADAVTGWVDQNLPTIAAVIPTLFDEKNSPF